MPDPTNDEDASGFLKESAMDPDHTMASVLKEWDAFQAQRDKRKALLKQLEKATDDDGTVGCLGFFCAEGVQGASIDADDIPPLGDALKSLGDVDTLYLIINSPGGDGTVAEKMVNMCRYYCETLKVAVPNRAKSAATMIALGSDEIVMGYASELGPIDPQVVVLSSGVHQYVSAQAFIDAKKDLEDQYQATVAAGEDAMAILQQLASLDPAFIKHCENLTAFSKDAATKSLGGFMFKGMKGKKAKIKRVLDRLSGTSKTKVHARMIDANAAKTDLGLNVRILPKDNLFWKLLWDYYVRADIAMKRSKSVKLIETKHDMLIKAGA